MSDKNFELNFAKLADSTVTDRLPSLVPYKVGFQLIDKSDDDRKAVGINAFVVNEYWAYVPTFFIRGNLKGTDLLYILQHDAFVPANDGWINSLRDNNVQVLGALSKDKADKGTTSPGDVSLGFMTDTQTKTASSKSVIDKEAMQKMFNTVKTENFDLCANLPLLGKEAMEKFSTLMTSSTDFANAVFRYHDPKDLAVMVGMLKTALDEQKKDEPVEVEIITKMTDPGANELNSKEKTLLTRNGSFVKDTRKSHSKLYRTELSTGGLENPTCSGIYDVIRLDGTFYRGTVIIPSTQTAPNKRKAYIVPDEASDQFIEAYVSSLFGRPSSDNTDFKETLNNTGEAATVRSFAASVNKDKRKKVLIFTDDSDATLVELNRDSEGNLKYWIDSCFSASSMSNNYSDFDSDKNSDWDKQVVIFTGRPGKVLVDGGRLIVPEGARFLDKSTYKNITKFSPGSLRTIHNMLMSNGNLHTVKVMKRDNSLIIASEAKADQKPMTKEAALKHLVLAEGIEGGQAQQILNDAGRNEKDGVSFFIKYAASYPSSSPANRQTGPVISINTVGGKSWTPAQVIQMATDAAKTGIQDVFDVTVLSALIEASDISELRKDFLYRMLKGLDAQGRMLYILYWNWDTFEEKYGKDELKRLEDRIRNVFRSQGDLVLYLKDKINSNSNINENMLGMLSDELAVSNEAGAGAAS